MNEQSANPTAATQPPPHADQSDPNPGGQRWKSEQARDLGRLRRSSTDRYVAGVAGGLGRHFDVDPTIVRVLLTVLAFFGGAGLLIYLAVWIFVPEDGKERAGINFSPDVRNALLIGTGVIAVLLFLGTTFSDDNWGFAFPVFVLALIAVVVLVTRDRRNERQTPPVPWGGPATPTGTPQEGTTMSVTDAPPSSGPTGDPYAATAGTPGQQPPAWMPPTPPPYVPPPRPQRTGLVLFWPTLALIAIALGTLGIFDSTYSISVAAYAALAVAITGVMLLVGAFVARPGGLIALGLLTAIALGITSAVDASTGGSVHTRDLTATPTTAAAVQARYAVANGTIDLDLTEVTDVAALDGKQIAVRLNAGEITVWVPRNVNVNVDAEIRYAGEVRVGDDVRGGFNQGVQRSFAATIPNAPTIDLEIDARVGQITVEQD